MNALMLIIIFAHGDALVLGFSSLSSESKPIPTSLPSQTPQQILTHLSALNFSTNFNHFHTFNYSQLHKTQTLQTKKQHKTHHNTHLISSQIKRSSLCTEKKHTITSS
jgi:hypothetical protein